MNSTERILKPLAVLTASSLICLLSMALLIAGGEDDSQESGSGIWNGAVPVVFESGADRRQLVEAAAAAGYPHTVTMETQNVPVFSFDGMRELPISRLKDRYDDMDPLYDAFLRKMPSFFKGALDAEPAEVLYIITGDAPETVAKRLAAGDARIRGRYQVAGAGRNVPPFLLPALCALLTAFMLYGSSAGERMLFLGGSVPFLALSAHAHAASYAAVLLFPLFWRSLAAGFHAWTGERFRRGRGAAGESRLLIRSARRYGLYSAASLLFAVLVPGRLTMEAAVVLPAVLLSAPAFAAGAAALEALRSLTRQHPRFIPVSMRERGRGAATVRAAAAVLCAAVFLPVFVLESVPDHAVSLPLPSEHEGGERNAPSRHLSAADEPLPAPGDFFAHSALHEGYLYGMTYRVPEPGETLQFMNYSTVGGELRSEPVIVKMFTEEWYEAIMARQANNGVIGLLLDRENGSVRYGTMDRRGVSGTGWKALVLFVYAVMAASFAETAGKVSSGHMESRSRTVRRKEQAA